MKRTSKKSAIANMKRVAIQAGETKTATLEQTSTSNATAVRQYRYYLDPVAAISKAPYTGGGGSLTTITPIITTGSGTNNITGDKFFHLRSKLRVEITKKNFNSATSPCRQRLMIGYTKRADLGDASFAGPGNAGPLFDWTWSGNLQTNSYTVLYDQVQEFRTLEDHVNGSTHNKVEVITFDVTIPSHYNLQIGGTGNGLNNSGRLFMYMVADDQSLIDTDAFYATRLSWQMWFKEV